MLARCLTQISKPGADVRSIYFCYQGDAAFFFLPDTGEQRRSVTDLSLAMQYGYSSGNGLGVGLPGARWLMDEFNIESSPGKGTVVTMTKWLA